MAIKGIEVNPLPPLVTSTASKFPLGPITALAVAPLPEPPNILTKGGPFKIGPVSHEPPGVLCPASCSLNASLTTSPAPGYNLLAATMQTSTVFPPFIKLFDDSIIESPIVPGNFLKESRFLALSNKSVSPPVPPTSPNPTLSRVKAVLKRLLFSMKLLIPDFNCPAAAKSVATFSSIFPILVAEGGIGEPPSKALKFTPFGHGRGASPGNNFL